MRGLRVLLFDKALPVRRQGARGFGGEDHLWIPSGASPLRILFGGVQFVFGFDCSLSSPGFILLQC